MWKIEWILWEEVPAAVIPGPAVVEPSEKHVARGNPDTTILLERGAFLSAYMWEIGGPGQNKVPEADMVIPGPTAVESGSRLLSAIVF